MLIRDQSGAEPRAADKEPAALSAVRSAGPHAYAARQRSQMYAAAARPDVRRSATLSDVLSAAGRLSGRQAAARHGTYEALN